MCGGLGKLFIFYYEVTGEKNAFKYSIPIPLKYSNAPIVKRQLLFIDLNTAVY